MPRKVLVTGGAGFIGSHVVEAYLAAGDEVTVLDDLSTGRRDHVPAGVRLVEADIRSAAARHLVASGASRSSTITPPRSTCGARWPTRSMTPP